MPPFWRLSARCAARQPVRARAVGQRVVACAAIQHVVAVAALEIVCAVAAGHPVRTPAAQELDRLHARERGGRIDDGRPGGDCEGDTGAHIGEVDEDPVDPGSADRAVAGVDVQLVMARTAVEDIPMDVGDAAGRPQYVVAVAAVQCVLAVPADQLVLAA
jgi:hypothetical protein